MDFSERSGRQERQRGVKPCSVSNRHEHAIGDARVKMDVAVDRRAEAMQEKDRSQPRAGGCEGVGVNRHACHSTRLLVRLGQTFDIPAIDSDCPFSATVRQKTAGMRNRE